MQSNGIPTTQPFSYTQQQAPPAMHQRQPSNIGAAPSSVFDSFNTATPGQPPQRSGAPSIGRQPSLPPGGASTANTSPHHIQAPIPLHQQQQQQPFSYGVPSTSQPIPTGTNLFTDAPPSYGQTSQPHQQQQPVRAYGMSMMPTPTATAQPSTDAPLTLTDAFAGVIAPTTSADPTIPSLPAYDNKQSQSRQQQQQQQQHQPISTANVSQAMLDEFNWD